MRVTTSSSAATEPATKATNRAAWLQGPGGTHGWGHLAGRASASACPLSRQHTPTPTRTPTPHNHARQATPGCSTSCAQPPRACSRCARTATAATGAALRHCYPAAAGGLDPGAAAEWQRPGRRPGRTVATPPDRDSSGPHLSTGLGNCWMYSSAALWEALRRCLMKCGSSLNSLGRWKGRGDRWKERRGTTP